MTTLTLKGSEYGKEKQIFCSDQGFIDGLNALRKDAAIIQKRGLPFMMASVVLWTAITISRIVMTDINAMNFFTFMISGFLMPLASIFGKLMKADIYRKTNNPINRLGFLCNINQFLYLPIAMWAYSAHPGSMLLIYAIIFAAHLLPFSWVYDSKIYFYGSVIESVGVILVAYAFGYPVATGFIVIMQTIVCIGLIKDIKKDELKIESID
ncbi:MAG: hypothetical protein K6G43_05880 [Lachnospiraceae bacterium]|nr:hypothetical protein [Lachnospiraceae bacterium]